MPTSFAEWTCLLLISIAVGAAVGLCARRLVTMIVAIILLQFVAAPLVYWIPPLLEHGPTAEYQAWQFLIIPMLAVQGAILSFLVALVLRRFRGVVEK